MKEIEKFRKKLKTKCSIGTWMQIGSAYVAKNLSQSKAEWVVLDLEHGFFDLETIPPIVDVIKKNNKFAFARLCENTESEVKKVLEAGCDGLIFPRIDCEKKLNNLIMNAFYPPLGNRSYGFSYDNCYGKKIFELNKPYLVAMIESIKGVNKLEKILDNKLLDAVIIGNYDLKLDWQTKKNSFASLNQIHQHIFELAKKFKKIYGIHVVQNKDKDIKKFKKKGCKFLPVSIDTKHLQEIL